MEMATICQYLNDFIPSRNLVRCLKKGAVRSWNCPLFSKTARCGYFEPLQVPKHRLPKEMLKWLQPTEGKETLCARCIFGVQTIQQGSIVYYCNYKKTYRRYHVVKCPWFQERKAKKQYANSRAPIGLERWLA